ncbi:thioredoxin [Lactococcus fujiensis]|uniref:Thioredoxin n=1 Tax=Lactococcus fujiensis JCM 16395 TaxID=1291764 RepID=A0A2A5RNZ5_9LACT|nr:thioredoxin [Lactococcus fujiensis]PCS01063.1 thioredoxin [Lactococcus fujiensis JCM 16395]
MEYTLTDQNFDVETSNGLVIIDFWAAWCGPCRMQAPVLKELSELLPESQLKVCKLNVDENQATAFKYNIMSIPTLMFKKDGKVVKEVVGVRSKGQLLEIIKELNK